LHEEKSVIIIYAELFGKNIVVVTRKKVGEEI